MRKFIPILLVFIFIVPFIGCSSNPVKQGKEISSIEIVRQSDNKIWTFTDKDTIAQFMDALNNREKTNAEIDIRPHDYVVTIYYSDNSNEGYRLWIDEDINVRGVLMNEETTWFIHSTSNSTFHELLK